MKDHISGNEVIHKEVVVIGNGPSGISLSAMLSGLVPYLISRDHPDEMLSARLHAASATNGHQQQQTCHSLVQQQPLLEELAHGLEGRTTNPVSLLLDALEHPCADLGVEMPALIQWRRNGDKQIDHVVLGKGPPGGSWHTMDPNVLTLSLSSWMALPGLPYTQTDITDSQRRASAGSVARYYQNYVHEMNLDQFFRSGVQVLSVQPLDYHCTTFSAVVTVKKCDTAKNCSAVLKNSNALHKKAKECDVETRRKCSFVSALNFIRSRTKCHKQKPKEPTCSGRTCKRPRDSISKHESPNRKIRELIDRSYFSRISLENFSDVKHSLQTSDELCSDPDNFYGRPKTICAVHQITDHQGRIRSFISDETGLIFQSEGLACDVFPAKPKVVHQITDGSKFKSLILDEAPLILEESQLLQDSSVRKMGGRNNKFRSLSFSCDSDFESDSPCGKPSQRSVRQKHNSLVNINDCRQFCCFHKVMSPNDQPTSPDDKSQNGRLISSGERFVSSLHSGRFASPDERFPNEECVEMDLLCECDRTDTSRSEKVLSSNGRFISFNERPFVGGFSSEESAEMDVLCQCDMLECQKCSNDTSTNPFTASPSGKLLPSNGKSGRFECRNEENMNLNSSDLISSSSSRGFASPNGRSRRFECRSGENMDPNVSNSNDRLSSATEDVEMDRCDISDPSSCICLNSSSKNSKKPNIPKGSRWLIHTYEKSTGKFTTYTCNNLVLANGSSDLPNRLGLPVEAYDLSWVLHDLRTLERKLDGFKGDPDPVLVVGAGLSAADAVIATRFRSIPVLHVFRNRSVSLDKQLPENMYPEYHKVHQMMLDGGSTYPLYTALPEHTVADINAANKTVTILSKTGVPTRHKVSFVVILIGSRPNLTFLPGECSLGVNKSAPIDAKSNPADIDKLTHRVNGFEGLYAIGPLAGDNFVRFIPGGALAVVSDLYQKKNW